MDCFVWRFLYELESSLLVTKGLLTTISVRTYLLNRPVLKLLIVGVEGFPAPLG